MMQLINLSSTRNVYAQDAPYAVASVDVRGKRDSAYCDVVHSTAEDR